MAYLDSTIAQVVGVTEKVISSCEVDRHTYQECILNGRRFMLYHSDSVLQEMEMRFKHHLENLNMPKVSHLGDRQLLKVYNQHWQEYSSKFYKLNCIFGFQNSKSILDKASDIERMALICWKQYTIEPLKERLHNAILKQISEHGMHHDFIQDFMASYLYFDDRFKSSEIFKDFETALFNETLTYLQQEALKLLKEYTEMSREEPEEFLGQLYCKLEEEHDWIRVFLPKNLCEDLVKKCKEYLKIEYFILKIEYFRSKHGSCEDMFINGQWDDVHYLYTLASQTEDGTTELEQKFKEHIEEIHRCSIPKLQALQQQQFTTELCNLHEKYSQIVADIFKGNMKLQTEVNNFCRDAVNSVKTPELLVSHCDFLLNKMSQLEADANECIRQFVTVFQYTDNKYVYQSLYSKHLARRLLQSGPISLHTERSMIDILKDKCGFEYTRKFQEMLKDVSASTEIMTEFSNFVNPKENELSIQLNIKILQPYAWPLAQNALPCSLPFELEKPIQLFEQFYHGKFSGRKLTWMHSLGNAEVGLLYLKKKYIVCLGNSYQLALLLSFEEHDVMNTEELATNTKLPERELLKHLQLLVNAKLLVATTPVCNKSVFSLNMTFKNKHTRIRVKTTPKKSPQQDDEAVEKALEEHRAFCVQACIVKIMKAAKVLQYNVLVKKVRTQCRPRFLPTVSMIDKGIEKLVTKEYMEPTADAVDTYSYIA